YAVGNRAISLWDAQTGRLLLALPRENSPVIALAWSPNRDYLAVGSADGGLALWNLPAVRSKVAGVGLDWGFGVSAPSPLRAKPSTRCRVCRQRPREFRSALVTPGGLINSDISSLHSQRMTATLPQWTHVISTYSGPQRRTLHVRRWLIVFVETIIIILLSWR